QRLAQTRESAARQREIVIVARERDARGGLAPLAREAQAQVALRDAPGLAYQRPVEAHKIGALGRKIAEQRLAARELFLKPCRQVAELRFHRAQSAVIRCSAAARPSARSARAAPRRRGSSACL